MTRRIDLFIASPAPLGELAAVLASRAELDLEPGPGPCADEAVILRWGELAFSLSEHCQPDGDELRLSRYRYALSATTDAEGHVGDVPETRALRRLAGVLADDFDVLLVVDLQFREQQQAG